MIDETQARLARLQAMRDAGIDPYPSTTQRTNTIAEFLKEFETFQVQGH